MTAFVLTNSIFLHIPRCGGTAVRKYCRNQGMTRAKVNCENGAPHPTLALVRERVPELPVFCFVRPIVEWMESLWMFAQHRSGSWRWTPGDYGFPFGPHYGVEDFFRMVKADTMAGFMEKYLALGRPIVSEFFRQRLEPVPEFVGRTSHLREDLGRAFEKFSEGAPPHAIDFPRRNSYADRFPDVDPTMGETHREAFLAIEDLNPMDYVT